MARMEPPRLAQWMLEHLIPPAERDEALTGDLEEHYSAGRSDAWYWCQATAAVATGWTQYFSRRGALLVFALLWSMLAPAWYAATSDFEASHDFGKVWEVLGPFVLVGWTALHAAYLWAGLMVYQFVHRFVGRPLPRKEIRRAFWIVPLLLPPIYGIAFVLTAIYGETVPALQNARLAGSVLGQVSDLGLLADLIRIPYFLTLAGALWGTAQHAGRGARSLLLDTADGSAATVSNPPWADSSWKPGRFFAFVVAAGATNALICGFLLCRLPDAHSPSLSSLLLRAAVFVALGVAAGTAGTWAYWNNPASPFRDSAPIDFRLFALVCAAAWIWLPALTLLYLQVTAFTSLVASVAAFALAAGLRQVPMDFASAQPAFAFGRYEGAELFADPFLRPRSEGSGMLIALAIYAGGFAMATQFFLGASMLLGLAAFLLGWRRTVQRREPRWHEIPWAAFRLMLLAMPAVLITVWALMTGVAHRNRLMAEVAAQALEGEKNGDEKAAAKSTAHGLGGYDSVILWPYPAKKQIVAPLPLQNGPLAPGTRQPLVVEFDGPYWYVQPPDKRPGPDAHHARGSPLGVNIEANNSVLIVMEARQRLAASIPLARCGEIDVEIENREQHLGVIGMALILEDSSLPRQQIYAGRQRIYTGDPDQVPLETIRFKLPQQEQLRRFDGITLMLLPETEGVFRGPRIAVRDFRLYPR